MVETAVRSVSTTARRGQEYSLRSRGGTALLTLSEDSSHIPVSLPPTRVLGAVAMWHDEPVRRAHRVERSL